MALTARYEIVDGEYMASVVELPGCMSMGKTLPELRENLLEAIEGYLEIMRERAPDTDADGTIEFDVVPA